jgi:hypothetical protein
MDGILSRVNPVCESHEFPAELRERKGTAGSIFSWQDMMHHEFILNTVAFNKEVFGCICQVV